MAVEFSAKLESQLFYFLDSTKKHELNKKTISCHEAAKEDRAVKDRTLITRYASLLLRNIERVFGEIGDKCRVKREDVFKL